MNIPLFRTAIVVVFLFSCRGNNKIPSKELINDINLKRGKLISCGSAEQQFGNVRFDISSEQVKEKFNLGVKLLHSFEYDEAEKVFADIIDEQPACAMAYWGVAMANFHPLWTPPSNAELQKGSKAIYIAHSLEKSEKEKAFISAIAAFYTNYQTTSHPNRAKAFEKASEKVAEQFPDDDEAKIFYALSMLAAADPADKSYVQQKKANGILESLYKKYPDHPGIVHYLIHANDYPELASAAIPMANKYASVAPSSAHALHMPSHIFTRLGMWDESIQSNLASVDAAKCYAQTAGIAGHWDEELHALDYLVYAYLQQGNNYEVQRLIHYLDTIETVSPMNFKVAYAFATIPARYILENRLWQQAAALEFNEKVPWKQFGWQAAIVHFARSLGSSRTGDLVTAKREHKSLDSLYNSFVQANDPYKAVQVKIQSTAALAWIRDGEGNKDEALGLMKAAADLEGKTEKHPVTPGEVLPALELLGDMYLLHGRYHEAAAAYEENQERNSNRFNGLYGLAKAAGLSGSDSLSQVCYAKLDSLTRNIASNRSELAEAKRILSGK